MSATYQLSFDLSDRDLVSPEVKLHNALECLNSVPYLNSGGCGIAALAIYRWCKDNGVEVSDRPFVVLAEDEWDADACNRYLENNDLDNAWFSHIAIEIDGEVYDSEGTGHLDEQYVRCAYRLDEDELLYALNEVGGWNDMFHRKSGVRVIEYGLQIDLSDVDVD